ncbi:ankyrin repeat-containing domain protein [Sphaerosporella brunnea]|uniref:Ankyrin repeat-containing domain protein n=1 Tax=Sphaerosporella brunnea TaxID=1250544 RepID=A0A5J5EDZ5_9PEZI|nr:ankyrin repeat-containing domain protein [Sphaerosporella brunnea]
MCLTLNTIPPELMLTIAEHLPLLDLHALVRTDHALYRLLLRSLYKRALAIATPITIDVDNPFNHWRNSPWMGNARQVTLSLAAGMDPNMRIGFGGITRLHLAASRWYLSEEVEVMELLLARGADVDARDGTNRTPLHAASEVHTIEPDRPDKPLKLLIQSGADVNARTIQGMTPLHYAVQYGQDPRIVALLMEHGADSTIVGVGYYSHSPLGCVFGPYISLGRARGDPEVMQEIVRVLVRGGASVGMLEKKQRELVKKICDRQPEEQDD